MTDAFDRLCGTGPGPVGIAVSGGSDSLALLVLAKAWSDRTGRPLIALTVDHRLRPEAADEARFVAEICARIGVDHQTLVWDRPVAKQALARRAFIARVKRSVEEARVVLGPFPRDDTRLQRARVVRVVDTARTCVCPVDQ